VAGKAGRRKPEGYGSPGKREVVFLVAVGACRKIPRQKNFLKGGEKMYLTIEEASHRFCRNCPHGYLPDGHLLWHCSLEERTSENCILLAFEEEEEKE
jgi:hypothetical protein